MRRHVKLKRHVPKDHLIKMITIKRREIRYLSKLELMLLIYQGKSVDEASRKIGVTRYTGYLWLRQWNSAGIEGLEPRRRSGRPRKIKDQQLRKLIEGSETISIEMLKKQILERYNVKYSDKQISNRLSQLEK